MTELIAKYQKYVDNIEWHIRTNQPENEKLTHCNEQLYCYKEIIADLKAAQQPTLPGDPQLVSETFTFNSNKGTIEIK